MTYNDKNNGRTIEDDKSPLLDNLLPFEKGYQPTQGHLDTANPPKGGSGVPLKESGANVNKN